jgi:hypothetical protein
LYQYTPLFEYAYVVVAERAPPLMKDSVVKAPVILLLFISENPQNTHWPLGTTSLYVVWSPYGAL